MEDRYSKREFELAFKVLSVRPPELVIRPFKIEIEKTSESKKGLIEVKTNSAFLQGRYPTASDTTFSFGIPNAPWSSFEVNKAAS